MHKRFLQGMAMALAGIMIVTGLDVTAFTSYAAENSTEVVAEVEEETVTPGDLVDPEGLHETRIALKELTKLMGWGNTEEVKEGSNTTVITYSAQYGENAYLIPEDILEAGVVKVSINVKDCDVSNYALKFYNAFTGNDDKTELKVEYGKGFCAVPEEAADQIGAIGIMNLQKLEEGEVNVAKITSVSFYTKDEVDTELPVNPSEDDEDDDVDDPEIKDQVIKCENLSFSHRWSNAPMSNPIRFSAQYDEYCYTLPVTVDLSKCESITVKVGENLGVRLAVKLYDVGMTELKTYYGVASGDIVLEQPSEGVVSTIGFMALDEGDYTDANIAEINSITIVMKGGAGQPEGDAVVYENPTFVDRWSGEEVTNPLVFQAQWNERVFVLPEPLDMSKCEGIDIEYADQNVTLAIKLLGIDDQGAYIENDVKYNVTGTSGVHKVLPGQDVPLNAIGIMASEEADYEAEEKHIAIKKITFHMNYDMEEKSIEEDIVNLRDAITDVMGEDFIVGTSICNSDLRDELTMKLVEKHFNAITLGNELKPDAMFGYAQTCPELVETELRGEKLMVPTLDFSRAELTLDSILAWNEAHPESQIRVRGHVMVWHSQTPEWFFHEDYDASKPYVDKATMDIRQEWYIKSVAEHFTGADSKYKDMFYGWDVVNEAVSDGTGTYRNDKENSSWWAVYQSNEFITNAFVYANKYLPKSVELYYNDYNEWMGSKVDGIAALLQAVKDTKGARIDGMGMQSHYQTGNFSAAQFMKAAKRYCDIVGKVQLTELDFKASNAYDGSKAGQTAEFERLAKDYASLYEAVRRLNAGGYKVDNITVWGVIDKNSWLQSQNNVGGGADGKKRQVPLLFDDYYKSKPCFWVFVNPGELAPEIKTVIAEEVISSPDLDAANCETTGYTFEKEKDNVEISPAWTGNSFMVKVKVPDATVDATDAVKLYTVAGEEMKSLEVKRSDAEKTAEGYVATLKIPVAEELIVPSTKLAFDVVVTDGKKSYAFNDTTMSQNDTAKYYAIATLVPCKVASKRTVKISEKETDAIDPAWNEAQPIELTVNDKSTVSATAKLLWDENYLYVLMNVKDAVLNKDSKDAYQQDSLEVFIDENNHKSDSYEEDDKQYRINYVNEQSFNGKKCLAENVKSFARVTEEGYTIEAAFKWTDITPAAGSRIGLDLQINDAAANGVRTGTLNWSDNSGMGWSSTAGYGSIVLAAKDETIYKVTYQLAGGTNSKANPSTYTRYDESVQLQPATRTGYAFEGWYSDAKYTKKFTKITKGSHEDITVYAKWAPVTYKVVFKANGGKGTMKEQSLTYDKAAKLSACKYTRTGYTFKGWNTKANGKGKAYKSAASVKNLAAKKGAVVTLYAQWKQNTYTVKFDKNGGRGKHMKSIKATYGELVKLTACTYQKEGYKFAGWSLSKKGKVVAKNKASIKNLTAKNGATVTLYAKWEVNSYTVRYLANGGKGKMDTQVITCNKPTALKANKFTRKGYTFVGWSTKKKGTKVLKNRAKVKNLVKAGKKVTLYAQWKKASVKNNKKH